jgi:hypothetical protein
MALKTYRNPAQSYLILPDQLLWSQRYVSAAIDAARRAGKEPRNVKSSGRRLKLHQLCCIAFAATYGLQEQFVQQHTKMKVWPPDTDFVIGDKHIRIVGVAAMEAKNFGATLSGRIWDNDFNKGRNTHYVLASWFPPYVDLVGWMSREDLIHMKERNWYTIQEANLRAMALLDLKVPA